MKTLQTILLAFGCCILASHAYAKDDFHIAIIGDPQYFLTVSPKYPNGERSNPGNIGVRV